MSHKFNPKQIDKLTNPKRIQEHDPELIWRALNLDAPQVLVDIGAGTGFFAVPFSRLAPDATVYACDSSSTMVDWMRTNLCSQERLHIIESAENQIPLEDNLADLVYMANLHHELENPFLMLKETKRLLKPGGMLLIIDWKAEEMDKGPRLDIRIPEQTVKSQLEQSGYQDITSYNLLTWHHMVTAICP